VQEDPIGYDGGPNLYGYVGGQVLQARDPSGEDCQRFANIGRGVTFGWRGEDGNWVTLYASYPRSFTLICDDPQDPYADFLKTAWYDDPRNWGRPSQPEVTGYDFPTPRKKDEASPSCESAFTSFVLSGILDYLGGGIRLLGAARGFARAGALSEVAMGLFAEGRAAASVGNTALHSVYAGKGIGVALEAFAERSIASDQTLQATIGIVGRSSIPGVPTLGGGLRAAGLMLDGITRDQVISLLRALPISGTVIRGVEAWHACVGQ